MEVVPQLGTNSEAITGGILPWENHVHEVVGRHAHVMQHGCERKRAPYRGSHRDPEPRPGWRRASGRGSCYAGEQTMPIIRVCDTMAGPGRQVTSQPIHNLVPNKKKQKNEKDLKRKKNKRKKNPKLRRF